MVDVVDDVMVMVMVMVMAVRAPGSRRLGERGADRVGLGGGLVMLLPGLAMPVRPTGRASAA